MGKKLLVTLGLVSVFAIAIPAHAAIYAVDIRAFQYTPSGQLNPSPFVAGTSQTVPDGTPLSAPRVRVGDKIKWTNNDLAPHNVRPLVGPYKAWGSALVMATGASYTLSITSLFPKGTYVYWCTLHPGMRGRFIRI